MKIAVVIPAYNESIRIGRVLTELKKRGLKVIVVDDGSKDDTSEVAKSFKVLTFRHRLNLGKGAALRTGCEAAFKMGYDAVIIMDSDGQHLTKDLSKFVSCLKTGKYDVVFGLRNYSKQVPLVRYLGNKAASILVASLFRIYIPDLLCGYRAFTKKAYKKIKWQSLGYGVETEMVIKVGKSRLRYCQVPVETIYNDKFKGVTIIDSFSIFFYVLKWRFIS